ncbi:unnamed protein product [Withania somnifera]
MPSEEMSREIHPEVLPLFFAIVGMVMGPATILSPFPPLLLEFIPWHSDVLP